MAYETKDGGVVCEQCGNEYQKPGNHWSASSDCDHPELTQLQKDILRGALLGGATVEHKDARNQRISVDWTDEQKCRWVDEALGWLSTGVRLKQTAEGAAAHAAEHELLGGSYDPDDWSDQYAVRTRSHPAISETSKLAGGFDPEVALSPTSMLVWYLGRGHYKDTSSDRYVRIAMGSEKGNESKIDEYFHQADLPEPSRWEESGGPYRACWSVPESRELFEFMEKSPLADRLASEFEDLFPSDMGGSGKSMSDVRSSQKHQKAL